MEGFTLADMPEEIRGNEVMEAMWKDGHGISDDAHKPDENNPEGNAGEAPTGEYDFKSKFGDDFDSEEKVKTTLEEYKSLKGKASEYESISEKVARMEELGKVNLFGDSDHYRLDVLKKTAHEDYSMIKKLVTGDMSDEDIIKASIRKDMPNKTDSQVNNIFKSMYKIKALDPDDVSEEEQESIDAEMYKMEKEARNIRESLLKPFNEIEVPETKTVAQLLEELDGKKPNKEEVKALNEARTAELQEGWSAISQELIKDISSIDIPVMNGDKIEVLGKFEITEEDKAHLINTAINYAVSNGLDFTDGNLAELNKQVMHFFEMSNKARINKFIIDTVSASKEKEFAEKYHNPSALQTSKDEKDKELTAEQLNDAEFNRAMNMK